LKGNGQQSISILPARCGLAGNSETSTSSPHEEWGWKQQKCLWRYQRQASASAFCLSSRHRELTVGERQAWCERGKPDRPATPLPSLSKDSRAVIMAFISSSIASASVKEKSSNHITGVGSIEAVGKAIAGKERGVRGGWR
jgi:hypothetical protein